MKLSCLLILHALSVRAHSLTKCVSATCVKSAANILERIDTEVDPCEDFYSFACGSFAENVFTPDEKSTVDSLSLISDKLQEFVLTLLTSPVKADEPKNHKLAKSLYAQCIDYDRVNMRGKEPLAKLLDSIGYPMISKNWNEREWEWKSAIQKLRYYVSKKSDDIFSSGKNKEFAEITKTDNFALSDDFGRAERNLRILMEKTAVALGADDHAALQADIDDLIKFEKRLSGYSRKFKALRRRKSAKSKSIEEFKLIHKLILWLEIFAPSVLSEDSSDETEIIPDDLNVQFYEFLKSSEERTLANYVGWRVLQVSIFLLGEEFRQIFSAFEHSSFGNEDFEQRWKLCTALVSDRAPVAVGALYISQFFSESDKSAAQQMVEEILAEYKETIKSSEWMDENTKINALAKTDGMLKFIGYHDKLRQPEADTYYDTLEQWEEFFESILSLNAFRTDIEFKRIHSKNLDPDWTKYSKPATVNAFYNSKDNSIQFPAAILQFPFYDKTRPDALNFGGIGSIIGHEITHAFDDLSSKISTWSESARNNYNERVECLIAQYSNYRVSEIEAHFNISEFHVNGVRTIRENIADNGGVKLAFQAFKRRSNTHKDYSVVGLEPLSSEKLFYVSFAQAFCSVERPAKMRSNVESDLHALSKFRVIGVLSNMADFSRTFNCSATAKMNPPKKCAVW